MGRNSAGTHTLVVGNPVQTGETISSEWANTTLADIANELSRSLDRGGRGAMTAPLKLTNGTRAEPAVTFDAERGSGFYRAAPGDVRLAVAGADVATWIAGEFSAPGFSTSAEAAAVDGTLTVTRELTAPVTATGSLTPRPLADHLADVVNVKNHGAKADTTTGLDGTDNGPFMQAAIDALPATGGTIFIPPGKYRIAKRAWTLPARPAQVRIVGAGRDATRLHFSGMGASDFAFDVAGTAYSTDERAVWFSDLWIGAGGGNGLRFGPYTYYRSGADRVEVNAARWAYDVDGTFGIVLNDCFVSDTSTVRGVYIHNGANTVHLKHFQSQDGFTDAGVQIDTGAGEVTIDGRSILQGWPTPNTSVLLRVNGASNVRSVGTHMEWGGASGANAVELMNAANVVLDGNTYAGTYSGPIIGVTTSVNTVVSNSYVDTTGATSFLTYDAASASTLTHSNNTGSPAALSALAGLDRGTWLSGVLGVGFQSIGYAAYNTDLDVRAGSEVEFTLSAAAVKFNNIWSGTMGAGQHPGDIVAVRVMNTTGGAASVDFGAAGNLRAGPSQAIAAGSNRTFVFRSNGTRWYEAHRSAADVAN